MGLEDKDIQSLYGIGLSSKQIADLGGNSIVIDVLRDIYKHIWPDLFGTAGKKQRSSTILNLFD